MIKCSEIGTHEGREKFIAFINSVKPGQFFFLSGYTNQDNERSNYWCRYGVKYNNLRARDTDFLSQVLLGRESFNVEVKHGAWMPPEVLRSETLFNPTCEHPVHVKIVYDETMQNGSSMTVTKEGFVDLLNIETFNNRKGKGRIQAHVSYELPSTHPLAISAIGDVDLQGTLMQGLIDPRELTTDFQKEGQGIYSLDKEGVPVWYIRDVLAVNRKVRVKGVYEFKASLPINAVKNAIKSQFLLTGKYRTFFLTENNFEYITIAGQAIMVDGVMEKIYFALPEIVKAELKAQLEAGNMVQEAVAEAVEEG